LSLIHKKHETTIVIHKYLKNGTTINHSRKKKSRDKYFFFFTKRITGQILSLININKTLNKYLSIMHLRKRRQIFVIGA